MDAKTRRRLVAAIPFAAFLCAAAFAVAGNLMIGASPSADGGQVEKSPVAADVPAAPPLEPYHEFAPCADGTDDCGWGTAERKPRKKDRGRGKEDREEDAGTQAREEEPAEPVACEPADACAAELATDPADAPSPPCHDLESCSEYLDDTAAGVLDEALATLPAEVPADLPARDVPVEVPTVDTPDELPADGVPVEPPAVPAEPKEQSASPELPTALEQPAVRLLRDRLRVSRAGRLSIPLACDAERVPCAGTLALLLDPAVGTTRQAIVAEAGYLLEPGETVRQRLRLTSRGRRALARHGRISATAVTETGAADATTLVERTSVLLRRR